MIRVKAGIAQNCFMSHKNAIKMLKITFLTCLLLLALHAHTMVSEAKITPHEYHDDEEKWSR